LRSSCALYSDTFALYSGNFSLSAWLVFLRASVSSTSYQSPRSFSLRNLPGGSSEWILRSTCLVNFSLSFFFAAQYAGLRLSTIARNRMLPGCLLLFSPRPKRTSLWVTWMSSREGRDIDKLLPELDDSSDQEGGVWVIGLWSSQLLVAGLVDVWA